MWSDALRSAHVDLTLHRRSDSGERSGLLPLPLTCALQAMNHRGLLVLDEQKALLQRSQKMMKIDDDWGYPHFMKRPYHI